MFYPVELTLPLTKKAIGGSGGVALVGQKPLCGACGFAELSIYAIRVDSPRRDPGMVKRFIVALLLCNYVVKMLTKAQQTRH